MNLLEIMKFLFFFVRSFLYLKEINFMYFTYMVLGLQCYSPSHCPSVIQFLPFLLFSCLLLNFTISCFQLTSEAHVQPSVKQQTQQEEDTAPQEYRRGLQIIITFQNINFTLLHHKVFLVVLFFVITNQGNCIFCLLVLVSFNNHHGLKLYLSCCK